MHPVSTLLCVAATLGQALGSVIPAEDSHGLVARADAAASGGSGGGGTTASGVTALVSSINDVQGTLVATNDAVTPFRGGSIRGLVGLLKINTGVVALGRGIRRTTDIVSNTGRLSTTDSTQVGIVFLNVQPNITSLIDNLVVKRPEFDRAGFRILDVRSLIRDDLRIQQQAASDLGTTLTANIDVTFQPVAQNINAEIQGNFSRAITAFGGRGGKIKIPTKAVPALSNLLNAVARVLGISATKMRRDESGSTDSVAGDDVLANIMAEDTPAANQAASSFMDSVSDDSLSKLGEDENDLSGVPPAVLAVLREYGVI